MKKKTSAKKKGPTKAQVNAAYRVIARSRDMEHKKDMKRKATLIGKCYKYRNTYGGDCTGWWLYVTPTHFSEHGGLRGSKFEHTTQGRLEIETEAMCDYIDRGGYTEISREEFDAAKAKFLAKVVEHLS